MLHNFFFFFFCSTESYMTELNSARPFLGARSLYIILLIFLQMACECLCTVTVLENLDCIDVIKRFLTLRTETLKNTFTVDDVCENVRVRVLNGYRIIINTLEVLFHNFSKQYNSAEIITVIIEVVRTVLSNMVRNLHCPYLIIALKISLTFIVQPEAVIVVSVGQLCVYP